MSAPALPMKRVGVSVLEDILRTRAVVLLVKSMDLLDNVDCLNDLCRVEGWIGRRMCRIQRYFGYGRSLEGAMTMIVYLAVGRRFPTDIINERTRTQIALVLRSREGRIETPVITSHWARRDLSHVQL